MSSASSGIIYPNSEISKQPMDLNGTWSGADILGNLLNRYTASAREAALADRAWTAMREDTAIQRRVKDLEAAGLNPWLAVQSGLGEGASASASQVGKETNDAIAMAASAAQVLAQYASLPSKNFKALTSGIKSIVDSVFNRFS